MDESKMQVLREAFRLFDLDGGGSIEAAELGALLRALGMSVTEESVAYA